MSLRVEVLQSGGQQAAATASVAMIGDRLTIGRSDRNDLTLPDPTRVISNQHLVIEQSADGYVLVDKSTNGVRLNGSPVAKGDSVPISDGDQIQVGNYELCIDTGPQVAPGLAHDAPAGQGAPGGPEAASGEGLPTSQGVPSADTAGGFGSSSSLDPLKVLDQDGSTTEESASADPFQASEPDHGSGVGQHMPMPRILQDDSVPPPASAAPESEGFPEDIPEALRGLMAAGGQAAREPSATPSEPKSPFSDPFGAEAPDPPGPAAPQSPAQRAPESPTPPQHRAAPQQAPVAPAAPSGTAGAMGDLAPLLEGLGLKADTRLDAQQLFELGRVVALLLDSFISALAIRSRFKAEFGVARTMIQSTKNNPIKLSQSSAEALERLFVSPHQGYLGALEAADDAVSDLATHELAMFSALKTTNRAILEQLDPDRLADEFQRQAPQRLGLGVLNKSRYWDEYRRFFEGRLQDSDPVLLYFAEGYDQAVKELESRQSGQGKDQGKG